MNNSLQILITGYVTGRFYGSDEFSVWDKLVQAKNNVCLSVTCSSSSIKTGTRRIMRRGTIFGSALFRRAIESRDREGRSVLLLFVAYKSIKLTLHSDILKVQISVRNVYILDS